MPDTYIISAFRFLHPKKKCHAGRFDDSYRRHSAFDSLSLSFFEINTRLGSVLDSLSMLGHVDFYAGISDFVAAVWGFGVHLGERRY